MRRTLLEIPIPLIHLTLPIYAYGFMLMLGFIAGIFVARQRARSVGVDPDLLTDLGVYAVLGGVVGARALFVVLNWREFAARPLDLIRIDKGGLVFYGGLVTASALILWVLWRKKVPVAKVMDIIAPSVALGLAFGRVGCFMNGCCYGKRCDPNWALAVRFPRTLDAQGKIDGSPVFQKQLDEGLRTLTDDKALPVHPAQLYSAGLDLVLFFVITMFYSYRVRDGDVAVFFCTLYPVVRFLLECIREDVPRYGPGLSVAQMISIAGLVVFGLWFLIRRCSATAPRPEA